MNRLKIHNLVGNVHNLVENGVWNDVNLVGNGVWNEVRSLVGNGVRDKVWNENKGTDARNVNWAKNLTWERNAK